MQARIATLIYPVESTFSRNSGHSTNEARRSEMAEKFSFKFTGERKKSSKRESRGRSLGKDCFDVEPDFVGVDSRRWGWRTELTNDEMKERSNLFQCEFNQREIHDRVLVVQVMPDNYEMQEMLFRLQNNCEEIVSGDNEHTSDFSYTKSFDSDELNESTSERLVSTDVLAESSSRREETAERIRDSVGENRYESESGSEVGIRGKTSDVIFWEKSGAEICVFTPPDVFPPPDEISSESNVCESDESISDSGDNVTFENANFVMINETSKKGGSTEQIGDTEPDNVHVIKERRLYVHGCWLAVNSRYFRSLLFQSGMKECSSKEIFMKVTESEEKAFMTLIESIYNTDVLDDVDIDTLLSVIQLSVKFDVKFSMSKAKRVLAATPLTIEVCETIIAGAAKGGLPDLGDVMEKVQRFIVQEFKPLDETWESDKFANLSKSSLEILLRSDCLVVQSENTVFVALMHWITKHSEVYEDLSECSELLNLIRFGLMKPCYLHDVVRVHDVATQLDNFDAVYLTAITYHALPEKRRSSQISFRKRQWSALKTPTYMWIVDTDEKMFTFEDENSTNTRKSSSFWFLGYQMHLVLDISARKSDTFLSLVVENLSEDGSVKLAYNVDVKFSESLHKSYTSDASEYRGKMPCTGMYPFDEKYSIDEIKEIVLDGFVLVTIIFEISMEKLLDV